MLGKDDEAKKAYKSLYDLVSFIGFGPHGMTTQALQNITNIVVRVNKLFGTTDFLK